jgi:ribose transport system permease protein
MFTSNSVKSKLKSAFLSGTEVSLIIALLVMGVILAIATNSFMTVYNLTNLLKQASIIGVVAVAATIVIISGGIDLSVGAITGMSSLLAAILMSKYQLPIFFVIVLPVIASGIFGLYNGVIIKEFKVAPFIVTLGSMTIIRGLIEVIGNAKTIVGVYPSFAEFSGSSFLAIPRMAYIWIIMTAFIVLVLRYTRFGRNIFVIGCGEDVARLSGINLRLNIYGVYATSGLLCGIAGVLLTSRIHSATPTGGQGYELTSIAAAVIGGASLSGGKGSIGGAFLGTFLMILISNGGIQLGIDPFIMDMTTGALITLAVVLDQLRRREG